MFKLRIKNWWSNPEEDFADFTVDTAKSNYKKYQNDLKRKQMDYIRHLCDEIKVVSRRGQQSVETVNLLNDFMTRDFMIELKEYFENKGFSVKEESNKTGILTSWLRISWEDNNE